MPPSLAEVELLLALVEDPTFQAMARLLESARACFHSRGFIWSPEEPWPADLAVEIDRAATKLRNLADARARTLGGRVQTLHLKRTERGEAAVRLRDRVAWYVAREPQRWLSLEGDLWGQFEFARMAVDPLDALGLGGSPTETTEERIEEWRRVILPLLRSGEEAGSLRRSVEKGADLAALESKARDLAERIMIKCGHRRGVRRPDEAYFGIDRKREERRIARAGD